MVQNIQTQYMYVQSSNCTEIFLSSKYRVAFIVEKEKELSLRYFRSSNMSAGTLDGE